MTVCAEASSAEQAIDLFASHRPDVTLMDARLPGLSGTEATAALRRQHPDARIVMISTYGGTTRSTTRCRPAPWPIC